MKKQIDIVQMEASKIMQYLRGIHDPTEWCFFEELRTATGAVKKDEFNFLDAWAINYHPSKHNVVRCYEIKISKSDFKSEIRKPTKRRSGVRYSNEFYFVAPKGVLKIEDIPVECGLMEVEASGMIEVTIKAPFRDTCPPTWRFLASVCRRIDEPRSADWFSIKAEDDKIRNRGQLFLSVLEENIKYWREFNKGNKEVPDKIADELERIYYDTIDTIKKEIVFKGLK